VVRAITATGSTAATEWSKNGRLDRVSSSQTHAISIYISFTLMDLHMCVITTLEAESEFLPGRCESTIEDGVKSANHQVE
jgi:hypothetical protein